MNFGKISFLKTFLKKYSALVLPMCLLLGGIVLFIPTMLVGRTTNAKKQVWESTARELDSLARNTPPIRQAEQSKQSLERFQKEVEAVESTALQTTQRDLIKYGLFPKPADTSSQIYLDFGKRYRAAIEKLITDRLKALDAPTDSEIRAQTGQLTGPQYPGIGGGDFYGTGMAGMGRGVSESPIVDALCLARAEKITMYANPRVFLWYDFWESYQYSGSEQALRDCWFAQVAYWIYEDVVASIEAINAGYERVADAGVKRLLGVSFQRPVSEGFTPYSPTVNPLGGFGRVVSGDQPVFVLPGQSSPLAVRPWTGRVGNEDLDAVHFAVSVIADNRSVQAFLKELCSSKPHTFREGFSESGKVYEAQHNQITILQSTFASIDKQSQAHAYYRYGSTSVMRVDLVCEYLFYRKGYDEIKPEPIKVILGQSELVPATGAGMGGMGIPTEMY